MVGQESDLSTATSTPPSSHITSFQDDASYSKIRLQSWDSVEACNSPGSAVEMLKARRKKRKGNDLLTVLRSWIVQHQIGISINLILLLFLTHICFPRARRRTRSFFQLSYQNSSDGRYLQGPADLSFVTYWVVVFTGLRSAVMTYLLLPLSEKAGVVKTKAKLRFAEQAWLVLYYALFWSLGMYIVYTSPYWLNLHEMWTNFPTREMSGLMKWYYLVQFAFWLQQIAVVHIEERRKDHWQMLTHHLVTCALILASYGYYQTKVGNVILCVMDVVDLIFPTAKILKYSGYQTACDIAFGVFILLWFLARHVIYMMICWSLYFDPPVTMGFGCYNSSTGSRVPISSSVTARSRSESILPNVLHAYYDSGGTVCFNRSIHLSFLGLLLFLQGITIMWFMMILRVAWKVLKGEPAGDSRSDDEGEDEEFEDDETDEEFFGDQEDSFARKNMAFVDMAGQGTEYAPQQQHQEEVVGVEDLNLSKRRKQSTSPNGTTRLRRSNKGSASAGGLSLPGTSNHKELLGRIGCDKPS